MGGGASGCLWISLAGFKRKVAVARVCACLCLGAEGSAGLRGGYALRGAPAAGEFSHWWSTGDPVAARAARSARVPTRHPGVARGVQLGRRRRTRRVRASARLRAGGRGAREGGEGAREGAQRARRPAPALPACRPRRLPPARTAACHRRRRHRRRRCSSGRCSGVEPPPPPPPPPALCFQPRMGATSS